jgi:hypothetical protein
VVIRVLVIVLALTAPAAADEPSPSTAIAISAAVTGAGLGLGIASTFALNTGYGETGLLFGATLFLLGPTAGHWYAGRTTITTGQELIIAGLVTTVIGLVGIGIECYRADDDAGSCGLPRGAPIGTSLDAIGVGLVLTGVVWDIATAGDEARRRNRAVAPLIVPGGGGLSLVGRF